MISEVALPMIEKAGTEPLFLGEYIPSILFDNEALDHLCFWIRNR
jgi:hypothetical protein